MFGRRHHEHHEDHEHQGHRNRCSEERHMRRPGGFADFAGRFERGFGGAGRERHFDNGELRLVILHLVAEKPSYGYEIIKAIEQRMDGAYAPSPGVVYPTLTMLEEEGYATVASTESNKKLYTVTEAGTKLLQASQETLKAIFGRMEKAGKAFGRGRSPQMMRAMMNLKMAMRMRMSQGNLSTEQVRKVAEALDAAARIIDEV